MSKTHTTLVLPTRTSHPYGDQLIVAIETWYDPSLRLWTSLLVDEKGYQVIPASYGTSKAESIEDAKGELRIYTEANRQCRACGSGGHTFCNA